MVVCCWHLKKLNDAIAVRAKEHKYTVMMGRTHGVHAEPISFGLKAAQWLALTTRLRGVDAGQMCSPRSYRPDVATAPSVSVMVASEWSASSG